MEGKVISDLNEVIRFQGIYESIKRKVKHLENDLEDEKERHIQEIKDLVARKKVCVVKKDEWKETELVNFDDIKESVENQFKQGLFNQELEKYRGDELQEYIEQTARLQNERDELKEEIEQLKHRSFFERLFNIYEYE